ncbi:MAG TPA: LysR family transcriptional regulator [Scandinavium sp.]|jgi:DNA-binding transcriptional LysR family regulator
MKMKEKLNDLQAFVAVARTQSFTQAAALLGVSRSALSHAILGLEERLGIRLLIRTTRSVSPTDAGNRLLNVLGPRLDEIETELISLRDSHDKPAGTVRITANDHAIVTTLWPRLLPLLQEYPQLNVEFSVGYELTDIAAQQFDAGVRMGDQVDKDMIAVRITPDVQMAVVASPDYLSGHPAPMLPADLMEHNGINLRLPTHGALYAWEFENSGQHINVRVEGQTIFNNTFLMIQAALDGAGVAYVPYDLVEKQVESGQLVSVLANWCPRFPGYYLYYPSRKHLPAAFALVAEALRWKKRA